MRIKYSNNPLFLLFILILELCPGCKVENKKFIINVMEMEGKGPGWGLAIVMQTPDGHTYLFDTGSNYPNAGFDAGKDMIAPFLERNNIKEIDGVVISHSHNDHFGGFQYLVRNFKIKELYDNGYPFPSGNPEYDSIYKPGYINNGGIHKIITQGDNLNWDKNLEVVMLSPPEEYLEEDTLNFTYGVNGYILLSLTKNTLKIDMKTLQGKTLDSTFW